MATTNANGGPENGVPKPVNLDEENISGPEEFSEASNVGGGHRFENLIKSMMARIELNNSLAPIQQYGRHQRKANNRKKGQAPKKKQQNDGDRNRKQDEGDEGERPTHELPKNLVATENRGHDRRGIPPLRARWAPKSVEPAKAFSKNILQIW